MIGMNGRGPEEALRSQALALLLQTALNPGDVDTLFRTRIQILRGVAATDDERRVVEEQGLKGWEERPAAAGLLSLLARRVTDEGDREILHQADRFRRRLLLEAPPEPPRDAVIERLILERTSRKVQAQAAADLRQDELVALYVEMRKADNPAQVEALRPKLQEATARRQQALQALDWEVSELADLLSQRREHARAVAIASATFTRERED